MAEEIEEGALVPMTPERYHAVALSEIQEQTTIMRETAARTKARDEEWMTMVHREVAAFENIAAILDRLEKRG